MSDVTNQSGVAGTSLWHPLRAPQFRNLLIADLTSDIGTFIQGVASAWVMVSINAGPLYVALTQTASALPFFLLALPAGAIGDIVDKRRLILLTEIWMAGCAIVLATLSLKAWLTPILLLLLTFALSAGDALESPSWRAVLPELVSKEDLQAASALNGIEFNFARAIGPSLAGVIIAIASVSAAFIVNAISFVGVIYVVFRWKHHSNARTSPPETLSGATVAAIRFVRYSPKLRALLIRYGVVLFFASGLLALLPSVAHSVSKSSMAYGFLLGCFGTGAIFGALTLQKVRDRWSVEAIISSGVLILGLCTVASGAIGRLPLLGMSLIIGGGAWIVFISFFNVIVLNHTPEWVRARVLAIAMLVSQGAMAAGSALWGSVATRSGIHAALICAGAGTIASTVLGLFLKLPDAPGNVAPWAHWRLPPLINAESITFDTGPVLVTVEYDVLPEHQSDFLRSIYKFERIRRRDGAYRWGIFRDTQTSNHFLEMFLVASWAEHLRQHERLTLADRGVEERVRSYIQNVPLVRHLIYAEAAPN